MGFEPTRGDPIGLAGRRLSRSAKVSAANLQAAAICVLDIVIVGLGAQNSKLPAQEALRAMPRSRLLPCGAGVDLPAGQEAAAGKGRNSPQKLLGRFDFFALVFFSPFSSGLAVGAFAAFRGKPFEAQGFGFAGDFFFDFGFLWLWPFLLVFFAVVFVSSGSPGARRFSGQTL